MQIGMSLGIDIPTRYSELHYPPPNALRSIDDTPPPKSSITTNDAHRILLPRWALFFPHLNRFMLPESTRSPKMALDVRAYGRTDFAAAEAGLNRQTTPSKTARLAK
jgi:hypothetical protein